MFDPAATIILTPLSNEEAFLSSPQGLVLISGITALNGIANGVAHREVGIEAGMELYAQLPEHGADVG
jgi:hypothetical protein